MNLDLSAGNQLLQNALRNHALEARKRRGRFREGNREKMDAVKSPVVERRHESEFIFPPISNKPPSGPLNLETDPAPVEEVAPVGNLFPDSLAADLRRNQHIRRGRRPTRLLDKLQYEPFHFSDDSAERPTKSAPIRLTPEVSAGPQRFSQVAPLRIAPKGPKLTLTSRIGHSRSLSAPENVTPIDSPGGELSIILFYDREVQSPGISNEFSSDGSDDESVHSAISEPPSAVAEWSTNMFLVRGDSIDSWPTEFPVGALEDPETLEENVAGGMDLRRRGSEIGALGLKRQNTEIIAKMLHDRRQRAEEAMAARPAPVEL